MNGEQINGKDVYKRQELNLGLEDKLHTKVGALSGGQRQTLALLMACLLYTSRCV